jgi:hypothetical protein
MLGVRKKPGKRGEAGPVLRFLEFVHIRIRRPLYNWIHNGTNRRQIPKWDAEAQRYDRDRGLMTDAYRSALYALEASRQKTIITEGGIITVYNQE